MFCGDDGFWETQETQQMILGLSGQSHRRALLLALSGHRENFARCVASILFQFVCVCVCAGGRTGLTVRNHGVNRLLLPGRHRSLQQFKLALAWNNNINSLIRLCDQPIDKPNQTLQLSGFLQPLYCSKMTYKKTKIRVQPRANNITLAVDEEVSNIENLIRDYREIPVHCLTLLYKATYKKELDCLAMKVDCGIIGYLKGILGNMMELIEDSHGNLVMRLNQAAVSHQNMLKLEPEPPIYCKRQFESEISSFFSHDSIIWAGPNRDLLERRDFNIERSAYEHALYTKGTQAINEINRIRLVLDKYFPDGIRLDQISSYIGINLEVLGAGFDINSTTNNLPELFFRVDKPDEEPFIYNGFNRTFQDITGQDNGVFSGHKDPETIVREAIGNGLYQKTLLLIRETGVAGLKIGVWSRSIRQNFYPTDLHIDQSVRSYLDMFPRVYFSALARYGLINIESPRNIKNDLRAKIPINRQVESLFRAILSRGDTCFD